MKARKIETEETAMIEQIIKIHDEIPLAWDLSHHTPKEYLSKLLKDIQSSTDAQGFWIFNRREAQADPSIDGMIWAKIMKNPVQGNSVCKVNSFWIRPDLRNAGLGILLTEACLGWAREHGATRLECCTHYTNSRMREIFEKQGFIPGMVQYSLNIRSL